MLPTSRFITKHWLFAAAFSAAPVLYGQEPTEIPLQPPPTTKPEVVVPAQQPPTDGKTPATDEKKGEEPKKGEDAKKADDPAKKLDAEAKSLTEPGAGKQDSPTRESRRGDRGSSRPSRPAADQITASGLGKAEKLQLNVTDIEWDKLLEILEQRLGRTLNYVGKKPSGPCQAYRSDEEIPVAEVIDILNLMLIPKGHILQRQYNFLHCIEFTNNTIPPQYIERVDTLGDLSKKAKTEIVRFLFTPNRLVASAAATDFKEFVAPVGTITALASTNQLNITGTAEGVRQVLALISAHDGPQSNPPNFEAFVLKYIPAVDAELSVRNILGMPARDAKPLVPGNPNQGGNPFGGGGRGGNRMMQMFGMQPQPQPGQPGQPQPGQPAVDPTKGPFIAIDERSNTLHLFATPDKIAIARQLIEKLDQPNQTGAESQTPKFEVYEVDPGAASGLATAIGGVFEKSSDTRIEAHPDGNHILVHATPREHQKVKEIIAKMKGEGKRFEAIQLRENDAMDMATSVRKLLGQKEEDSGSRNMRRFYFYDFGNSDEKKAPGPQIAADAANNRLLVYGTESQIQTVKELLIQLGESSLALGADRGKTRVIQFSDADPGELESRIKDAWSRMQMRSPVSVEIIGRPKTTDDSEAPKKSPPAAKKEDEAPKTERKTSQVFLPQPEVRFASLEEPVKAKEQPPANTTGPQKQPQGAPPSELPTQKGVNIVVGRDSIMIQSDDPAALDAAEKMMRMLVQRPAGSRIVVYQLKSADSFDMSLMLDDLINPPRQNSFSFFGGEESEDEKAQRARIVSDSRTNRLIVTAPQAAHNRIKELLKVLDDETPENDIKAAARTIQVKYRSAESVAEHLREAFAPDVFQQQRGNQNQNQQQPGMEGFGRFGMFGFGGGMGGGGGGRGGRGSRGGGGGNGDQNSKGKIVIVAEEISNTISVTAPKPKFDEIEAEAKRVDEAAATAKQSVRVMTLKHTKPETMQKMLDQMFGVQTSEQPPEGGGAGGRQGQNNQGQGQFGGRFGNFGQGGGGNNQGGGGNNNGGGGRGGGGGGGRRNRN